MESLNSFKSARGIERINFVQFSGRPTAKVVTKTGQMLNIVVSNTCDRSKPLYVTHNPDKDIFLVINAKQELKDEFTL
jgi:hypothetical protein